ncbi:MAG: hypothetical protein ABIS50_03895 [Luteolibacter sp.]|uniref:hypothetical protein n=1 Tax=Luteolibacter sp. TaxID=1962973 RepID=UPI00326736B0
MGENISNKEFTKVNREIFRSRIIFRNQDLFRDLVSQVAGDDIESAKETFEKILIRIHDDMVGHVMPGQLCKEAIDNGKIVVRTLFEIAGGVKLRVFDVDRLLSSSLETSVHMPRLPDDYRILAGSEIITAGR